MRKNLLTTSLKTLPRYLSGSVFIYLDFLVDFLVIFLDANTGFKNFPVHE